MKTCKRDCPVCYSQAASKLAKFSRDIWNNMQCNDCGMIYLASAPDYSVLSEDLAWTKQFAKEQKRRKQKEPFIAWLDAKTRWRLHIFRDDEWAYIGKKVKSGNVLDIGCGSVDNIPQEFTPFGIEIEKQAAGISDELMRKRGGYVVHAPALAGLEQFPDEFFDGIIMRSYLEHEANPREVLIKSFNKLKPGGYIYIKVPNFGTINRVVRGINWCGFRFPDHLNYFGVGTIKKLAELEGYRFELKNRLTRFTNDNLHCFLQKEK